MSVWEQNPTVPLLIKLRLSVHSRVVWVLVPG